MLKWRTELSSRPGRQFKDNSLFMTDRPPDAVSAAKMRHGALSRWDNEGGATLDPHQSITSPSAQSEVPPLRNAELVQLRVRVIALENLVISLLAQSSDRQLDLVREMATYSLHGRGSRLII